MLRLGLALLQRILRVGQGLGGGIDISLRQAGVKEGLLGRLGCGERILECLPAGLGVSRAIGAELVGRFNRAIKRRRIGHLNGHAFVGRVNGLHQAVRVEGDLVDGGFTVVAEAGGEHAERRVVAMVGHEPTVVAVRVGHMHVGLVRGTLQVLGGILLQQHTLVGDGAVDGIGDAVPHMVVRGVGVVARPGPVVLAVAVGDDHGLAEAVQTVELLHRTGLDAHHVVVEFGDGGRTVAVQDVRLAGVRVGEDGRVDGLSNGDAFHRASDQRLVGGLVRAGRVVGHGDADGGCTVRQLRAVVEVVLAVLLLDGRRPRGAHGPRGDGGVLIAIGGRLVVLIDIEDHALVGPVHQVGGAERMEVVAAPAGEAVGGRVDPELAVEVVDVRVGVLAGQYRVVAHGDLLQRPGLRRTVAQINDQSTVLSQVGRTTIGERLTIKGELDGVVATVDRHLDGHLGRAATAVEHGGDGLRGPVEGGTDLRVVVSATQRVRVRRHSAHRNTLQSNRAGLLDFLSSERAVPHVHIVERTLEVWVVVEGLAQVGQQIVTQIGDLVLGRLVLSHLRTVRVHGHHVVVQRDRDTMPCAVARQRSVSRVLRTIRVGGDAAGELAGVVVLQEVVLGGVLAESERELVFIDLRLDIHLHSQLVTAIEQALRELGVGAVRAVELKHLALFGILGDLGVAVEGQVVAVLSGVGTLAVFEVILGNRTGAVFIGCDWLGVLVLIECLQDCVVLGFSDRQDGAVTLLERTEVHIRGKAPISLISAA